MKRELYARLVHAAKDKSRDQETLREEIAERYHLKVVSGRIPIPDLRIEYLNENDYEIQRRTSNSPRSTIVRAAFPKRPAPGSSSMPAVAKLTGSAVSVTTGS
jgi:hypothetical protein